jgi:hypothetical protein
MEHGPNGSIEVVLRWPFEDRLGRLNAHARYGNACGVGCTEPVNVGAVWRHIVDKGIEDRTEVRAERGHASVCIRSLRPITRRCAYQVPLEFGGNAADVRAPLQPPAVIDETVRRLRRRSPGHRVAEVERKCATDERKLSRTRRAHTAAVSFRETI